MMFAVFSFWVIEITTIDKSQELFKSLDVLRNMRALVFRFLRRPAVRPGAKILDTAEEEKADIILCIQPHPPPPRAHIRRQGSEP